MPEDYPTIEVETDGHLPVAVKLPHTLSFSVRIVDAWREAGHWWRDESESDFFRVERTDRHRGQYVIFRQEQADVWFLYRVFD